MSGSSTGVILLDSSMNLIASNRDALNILAFPTNPADIHHINVFLRDRIQSTLLLGRRSGQPAHFATEVRSGNRRYRCAAYDLELGPSDNSRAAIMLLLEREAQPFLDVPRAAAEYGLTPREQETVSHLVLGLTTKEIAQRMKVSPSTVNAFVRLAMVKLGVSNRSAVVNKVLCSHRHSNSDLRFLAK